MWPARSAIRPVPSHAVVSQQAVDEVEHDLASSEDLETRIDQCRREFEHGQPALVTFLDRELETVKDETAEALGQFLGVAVHRAFSEAFGSRLRRVELTCVESVKASYQWDEELRRGSADEVLESEDLVAIGQPHLVAFLRQQLDAAMEPDEDGDPPDVDVDAVDLVYRAMLIAILALGQSVTPPRGITSTELLM